jgi:hypothetical protein
MVTKEIKQFVITQMKESEWELEKLNIINQYKSKHLNIEHDTTISQKVTFSIKIPTGYSSLKEIKLTRKELGISYLQYRFLLISVKKSCNLVDKRKREAEIAWHWKKFLENNKELKRDNKINQVLD